MGKPDARACAPLPPLPPSLSRLDWSRRAQRDTQHTCVRRRARSPCPEFCIPPPPPPLSPPRPPPPFLSPPRPLFTVPFYCAPCPHTAPFYHHFPPPRPSPFRRGRGEGGGGVGAPPHIPLSGGRHTEKGRDELNHERSRDGDGGGGAGGSLRVSSSSAGEMRARRPRGLCFTHLRLAHTPYPAQHRPRAPSPVATERTREKGHERERRHDTPARVMQTRTLATAETSLPPPLTSLSCLVSHFFSRVCACVFPTGGCLNTRTLTPPDRLPTDSGWERGPSPSLPPPTSLSLSSLIPPLSPFPLSFLTQKG